MPLAPTPPEAPRTIRALFPSACWTCRRAIPAGEEARFYPEAWTKPTNGARAGVLTCLSCAYPPPGTEHPPRGGTEPDTNATTQHALPLTPTRTHEPAPQTQKQADPQPSTSAADAALALVRALQGQPQGIDKDALARELAPIAERIDRIENAPIDPAKVEAAARTVAAREAALALQNATANTPASQLVIAGTVPPADPLYHDANTTSEDIRALLARGSHFLVSGPSGSGKTYPIEQECARAGRRTIKVSAADGLTYSALIARPSQTTPSLQYRYGPLPLAMRSGAVLILDEVDKLDPLLAAVFHSAMEPDAARRTLYVPETGETITAEEGFQIAATCNGLRDTSGAYSAHRIDGAFQTRCRGVAADYLSATQEAELFERAGLDAARARSLAAALAALRVAHADGTVGIPPSTRLGVQFLRSILGRDDGGAAGPDPMTPEQAWRTCLLSLLPPEQVLKARALVMPNDARWSAAQ